MWFCTTSRTAPGAVVESAQSATSNASAIVIWCARHRYGEQRFEQGVGEAGDLHVVQRVQAQGVVDAESPSMRIAAAPRGPSPRRAAMRPRTPELLQVPPALGHADDRHVEHAAVHQPDERREGSQLGQGAGRAEDH
jgi:hypothetical protein